MATINIEQNHTQARTSERLESTRVLFISDPQIRHPSSNAELTWIGYFRQLVFHVNIRKSWRVTTRLRPNVVIFLGDMLASGKSIKIEAEWVFAACIERSAHPIVRYQQYVRRFKSIFPLASASAYYLPGNNDVG